MKTDPDFHPLAARWLDGQSTASEQAVLQEILSENPGAMAEFAALCQTEALLSQAPIDPAARRESLNALLSGKPWPERAAQRWRRHRNIRWSAAAALLVLGGGLWLAGSGSQDPETPASVHHTRPPQPPGIPGGVRAQPAADSADWSDPRIDPELRRLLERMPVADFKAHGSLADVAGSSLPELKNTDGTLIPVRVADEGDAPVFLEFKALMPAWHLLGLMALQTGTTVFMEDGALVFRRSEKPASLEDESSRTVPLANLRALLGLRAGDPEEDMVPQYTERTAQSLGSDIRFRTSSRTSIRTAGSARNVKVLATALDAALALPARITVSVAMITAPPDVDFGVADANSGTLHSVGSGNALDEMESASMAEIFHNMTSPRLAGVLTTSQSGRMLEVALRHEGVRFKALLDQPAIPNQEIQAAGGQAVMDDSRMESTVSLFAKAMEPVTDVTDLDVSIMTRTVFPHSLPESSHGISTHTLMWNGQTAVIGGLGQPDEWTAIFLVTVTPLGAGEEPDTPPSHATNGELSAIPTAGKPGFVSSPYLDTPVALDVSSLPSGSTLTCPFTGRKFRIP